VTPKDTTEMSPLDRLVRHHVGERTTFVLGAATEKIAEEIAREALADEDFRRAFRALVQAHAREIFEALGRPEPTRRPEPPREPRRWWRLPSRRKKTTT
jgi:hypothetical protein